jgi:hypothetical protein
MLIYQQSSRDSSPGTRRVAPRPGRWSLSVDVAKPSLARSLHTCTPGTTVGTNRRPHAYSGPHAAPSGTARRSAARRQPPPILKASGEGGRHHPVETNAEQLGIAAGVPSRSRRFRSHERESCRRRGSIGLVADLRKTHGDEFLHEDFGERLINREVQRALGHRVALQLTG